MLRAKIAELDEHAAIGSNPEETGIPVGFIDRVPGYPGTTARWRGATRVKPQPKGLARLAHFGAAGAKRILGGAKGVLGVSKALAKARPKARGR